MGVKNNKKKQYFSKADLAEFFLLHKERYSSIQRGFLFYSILYFCVQVLVFMTSSNGEGLYVLFAVIFIMLVLYGFKDISLLKHRKADPGRSEDFVSYLELIGAKRKKSFSEVLTKIEKIQEKKFPPKVDSIGKIFKDYEIFVSYFGVLLVLITYAIRWHPYTEKYGVVFIIGFTSLLLLSIYLIKIFLALLDYYVMGIYSDLFKNYVETKLVKMKERLDLFIKMNTNDFTNVNLDLIPLLQNWYEFYCSRYSSNDKVNEVVSRYHSLIFSRDDEYKYLETFVSVNGKIHDIFNHLSLSKDSREEEKKKLTQIKNFLLNYINLLEENIKHRSEQEKEILARRKSRQIQFFYLFSILNLIIALGSIVISIILLLK